MTKTITRKTKWFLMLAVASVPLAGASVGLAQYRLPEDGRALDASNRIGSGGFNSEVINDRQRVLVTGNQIINRNVSGGFDFRGNVPYRDPFEFRGNLAGSSIDRFVRRSAPPAQRYTEQTYNYAPQPVYTDSRGVPPPAGFVRSGSGTFVPQEGTINVQRGYDVRLGDPLGSSQVLLPRPGELLLPGQVDPTARQTIYAASPIYGVRSMDLTTQDRLALQAGANPAGAQGVNLGVRRAGYDDAAIQRMRRELHSTIVTDQQMVEQGLTRRSIDAPAPQPSLGQPIDPNAAAERPGSGLSTGQSSGQRRPGASGARAAQQSSPDQSLNDSYRMSQPIEAPGSGQVDGAVVRTPLLSGNAQVSNDLSANAVRERLEAQERERLVTPQEQSAQYADMRRRLEQFNAGRKGANARSGAMTRLAQPTRATPGAVSGGPAPAPAAPDGTSGSPAPKSPPDDDAALAPDFGAQSRDVLEAPARAIPGAPKPEPIKVESLATGVEAKGLADLFRSAETLMRDGKFAQALDEYEAAEQVAPNNPLVWVGRANAELGASYYLRAEQHLRQAFEADPALLMARYDLKGFFGEDRLNYIIKDLKDIMNADARQVRPAFLLAYIAYNSNAERRAAAYLDLAEKRVAGKDPFLATLREYWSLPAADAKSVEELNK